MSKPGMSRSAGVADALRSGAGGIAATHNPDPPPAVPPRPVIVRPDSAPPPPVEAPAAVAPAPSPAEPAAETPAPAAAAQPAAPAPAAAAQAADAGPAAAPSAPAKGARLKKTAQQRADMQALQVRVPKYAKLQMMMLDTDKGLGTYEAQVHVALDDYFAKHGLKRVCVPADKGQK